MPWLVIPALVLFMGVGKLVSEFAESRRRRTAFRGLAIVPIHDAANTSEVVQCVGQLVTRDALLLAPLRGCECAFLRVRVLGKRSAHARAPTEVLRVEERWATVSLEDSTGVLQLDMSAVRVEFDADRDSPRQFTTNLVGLPRDSLAVWIKEREFDTQVGPHGAPFEHLEIAEWVLEPGDEIAAVGFVTQPDGPYRNVPVMHVSNLHLLRSNNGRASAKMRARGAAARKKSAR